MFSYSKILRIFFFTFILDSDITNVFSIDWNSDIVPSQDELQAQNNDTLSRYFNKLIDNTDLFRTYDSMQKIIGDFKDVPFNRQLNHHYDTMTAWLKDLAKRFPEITYLYTIGKSVQGRELWVLIVSRNPREHELLKPEFKYVANMHGNEVVGREAVLYLAYILCENYGHNNYLSRMVNETRIHLMPSMNPDGYEMDQPGDRIGYLGRANANNVDLNRNFPARYPMHKEASGGTALEPETQAVMNWLLQYPFVLSANLHGGSLVANYPYDDSDTGQDGIYTPTKDDKLFVQFAYQYARAHSNMWKTGRRCGLSDNGDVFMHGITNGAGWYHLAGGMQDWQYVHSNSMEITIEMGCFKYPYDDMIPTLWNQHRFSLLSFMETVHSGVKGVIVSESNGQSNPIGGAEISIVNGGEGKVIRTTLLGEYWRLLPPGNFTLQVTHKNFKPYQFDVQIDAGPAKMVNMTLHEMECDGDDNPRKQYYVRGKGSAQLLLIGIDQSARALLTRLSNHTCPIDVNKEPKMAELLHERVRLHIFTEYNQMNILPLMKATGADALLVFAQGPPHSTVFNAGENTPRLFDQKKFDQSLEKAFALSAIDSNYDGIIPNTHNKQPQMAQCEDQLSQTRVAALVNQMALGRVFELGIGIGCGNSSESELATERLDAALTAIIETMLNVLRKDLVKEFSVIPSISPTDHFTPTQVQTVTKYGYDRLDKSTTCSAKLIEVGGMNLRSLGSRRGPHTLVMAIEMKTESLTFQLGARLCDQGPTDGPGTTPSYLEAEDKQVERILSSSTIILAPDIPHTQLNCHDYATISPFIQLLTQILQVVPEIDFVILLATGGVKVRFIDVRRPGIDAGITKNGTVAPYPSMEDPELSSETSQNKMPISSDSNGTITPFSLAQMYVSGHELMRQNDKDMCAISGPVTRVLDEFHWSMGKDKWAAAPNALLVQTGCCYEGQGVGHLFHENRRPLLSILERRLQGLSGTVSEMSGERLADASISVWQIDGSRSDDVKIAKTTRNGNYHMALEPGKYRALVSAEDFDAMSTTFTVLLGQPTVRDFALHQPFRMSLRRSLVALLIAFSMLSLSFYCLCKSLRRHWKPKTAAQTANQRGERGKDGFERVPLKDYNSADSEEDEEVLDTRKMANANVV